MTFPSSEHEPDFEDRQSSGARPMLATLVGVLLSLVALAIILVRLFPANSTEDAIATTTTARAADASSLSSAPTTTVAPDASTTTSLATASTTSTTVSDLPPIFLDVAVDAGSTTADISFTTPTCVNARYDYRGPTSGRHEGDGYPDATSCWTEHLAKLGEWTEALVPGSDYTVDISLIDAQGRTATTSVEFSTSS